MNGHRMSEAAPFSVYSKEPLMRAIASTGVTPVGLGIGFFVAISLTLSLWAGLFERFAAPETYANCVLNVGECRLAEWRCVTYVSYFANISWSASMLFLFPFVVGLGFKYCVEIPGLFRYLFKEITLTKDGAPEVKDFYRWLDRRFNSYRVSGAILALTLGLNAVYFYQILQEQKFISWMTSGGILDSLGTGCRGLTGLGVYAAIIQIVLIYWVLNLLWRGAVLAWGLHEFFNRRGFPIALEPLHPDGRGGLRRIGDVATLLNLTLFALGIYVSLKVVDKIIVQESSLWADIGNPFMLSGYVILAPLLFFFPLGAAHRCMEDAKEKFLKPVGRRCDQLFRELSRTSLDDDGHTAVRTFTELAKARNALRKEIPVWPFDFRSLQAFVGTIVVPVVPVVLSLLTEFFFGTLTK
jgi:hypothetical protein